MSDITSYFEANSGAFLLSLLIIALLAVALALVVALRLVKLSKPLEKLKKKGASEEMIPAILQSLEENRSNIQKISSDLLDLTQESRSFLQRSAIIRYDAFDDIGGKQSYSLCLLDGKQNGYLLTYLTGRNSTRSYAVEVKNGEASRKLSDEESLALTEALSGTESS